MLNTMKLKAVFFALLLAATFASAQDDKTAKPVPVADAKPAAAPKSEPAPKPEPKFFHLDFVVKEVEAGKVINSRAYSMNIVTNGMDNFGNRSIRTGTRVPIQLSDGKTTYIDVGVNIDCRNVQPVKNDLLLTVAADISSIQGQESATKSGEPVILQNKWNSEVVIPLGKPTTIFSSDEVTSRRTMQLELTATPIP